MKYFHTVIGPSFHLLIITCMCALFSCQTVDHEPEDVDHEWTRNQQKLFLYGICIDSLDVTEYTLVPGDNPAVIFQRLGFTPAKADQISQASAGVLDPTRLLAGMNYATFTTADTAQEVRFIAFAKSLTDYAVIDLTTDTVRAYEFCKEIILKRKYAEGTLDNSLWNVLKAAGADPLLALRISDIYAWQIDFFDVKEGDSFQVLYDVAYIDDTTALYIANVEGAVFTHQGKAYSAIPFLQDSVHEYFDTQGINLRKAFLKAPLDFFRISSRFSNARFHPVLKRYRAHHGVDYAAPTGTPVKSIGDGIVAVKGFQARGGGNYLKVKHNATYTTTYMHLSRFTKGIGVGKTVKQGEIIGYVGSTGLSTGPHLDFRVHKNGKPINPLNMEAPPAEPVHPALMDSFLVIRQRVVAELDSFRLAHHSPVTATPLPLLRHPGPRSGIPCKE